MAKFPKGRWPNPEAEQSNYPGSLTSVQHEMKVFEECPLQENPGDRFLLSKEETMDLKFLISRVDQTSVKGPNTQSQPSRFYGSQESILPISRRFLGKSDPFKFI
jgi:hypothetical protein